MKHTSISVKSGFFAAMVLTLSLGACSNQESDNSLLATAPAASLAKFSIDHRVTGQLPTAPAGIEGETFIFAKSDDGVQMKSGSGSYQTEWGTSAINMQTLLITNEDFQYGSNEYSPESDLTLWCDQLVSTVISSLNSAMAVSPEQELVAAGSWSAALNSLYNQKCK